MWARVDRSDNGPGAEADKNSMMLNAFLNLLLVILHCLILTGLVFPVVLLVPVSGPAADLHILGGKYGRDSTYTSETFL